MHLALSQAVLERTEKRLDVARIFIIETTLTPAVMNFSDLFAQRATGRNEVDVHRFLAVLFDGCCVSGPGLHAGYALLEQTIPCAGRRGALRNVLLQVAVDELVFDPLFIGAFFFSTGLVERQRPADTLRELRREYWPTLRGAFLTSAAFTPIQFCSFRYLPVKSRVLVVNLCDVAWYAAVSCGRHSERERDAHAGRTCAA